MTTIRTVESDTVLPEGKSTDSLDFEYDGGGKGKGGVAKFSVDGKQVAEGRIGKTQGYIFSADETTDVGMDTQTPVALGIGYGPTETKFTGKIHKIVVDVKQSMNRAVRSGLTKMSLLT